jgi:hypothetical protein
MSSISDNEDTNYDTPIYTVTTKLPIISYDKTYESHGIKNRFNNIFRREPLTKTKKIKSKEIQLYNKERYYYELPVTTKGKEINDIHTIDLYKTNFPDYYAYIYSIPSTYTYGTDGIKGITQTKKEEIVRTSIFYTKDQNGNFNKMLTKGNHSESEIISIKDKENYEIYDPTEVVDNADHYYQDIEHIMVFKFENDEWSNEEQQRQLNNMNKLEEKIKSIRKRKQQEKEKRKEDLKTFNSGPLGAVTLGTHDFWGYPSYGGKKEAAKIQRKINKEKKLLGKSKQTLRRSKRLAKTKRRRCPNETRRNKKTGKCEKK